MRKKEPISCWRVASCHCGANQIEVKVTSKRLLACNCSICTKKGFFHLIVSREDVRERPSKERDVYRFGSNIAEHYFCKRCGITPYYVPRSHPSGFSVNARCLEDFDLDEFDLVPFDGKNWERNIDKIR